MGNTNEASKADLGKGVIGVRRGGSLIPTLHHVVPTPFPTVRGVPQFMGALYRFKSDNGALGGRAEVWKELIGILNNNIGGTFWGMGEGSTTYYTSHRIVAHNTYLDILFENGIVGLALYLAYCISLSTNNNDN